LPPHFLSFLVVVSYFVKAGASAHVTRCVPCLTSLSFQARCIMCGTLLPWPKHTMHHNKGQWRRLTGQARPHEKFWR